MGAPKQKWTAEEEAALKAGVVKHGAGKWRTILKDPEFSGVLSLRSNVDLKDKWRNMSVTANGWGSREKARLALKRSQQMLKKEENALVAPVQSDEEIVDAKPLAVSGAIVPFVVWSAWNKRSRILHGNEMKAAGNSREASTVGFRLDSLIVEAITNLKEPSGSNKTAIGLYIEDQYDAPPNFTRILSAKLKGLTATGKLIKVKRKYRIAPSAAFMEARSSNGILPDGKSRDSVRVEKDDIRIFTKSQIDAELARMRTMTAKEAAAAAARAVAEAEVAMAEAEEAARDAEAAEADAEAAQAFAEAAMTTLKNRNVSKLVSEII
ncbi:hypothetical protein Sjap_014780 [Stephania japonica]|uniref:MYB transcription factor n=1 Tax=Stephania japonica TaxID=461633 RepID=A0AAP0IIZ1_9MAGN